MSSASRSPPTGVLPALLAGTKRGSHMCAFYEHKDDLIDLVLPFFSGGASRDESCVWMMPDSVDAHEAARETRAAVEEGGIELYSAREFYLTESHFSLEPVMAFWNEKLQQALDAGRSGLRASGDAFWLRPDSWKAFLDYETGLTTMMADKPMTVLCTFPLSMSRAGDILDVACAHHVAIARRRGDWEVIKGWCTGNAPLSREQQRNEALDAAERISSLRLRERQVLDRITKGHSNKQIAHDLDISVRTVEMHRSRLLDRLNVRTTAEAARLATLASLVWQA
jgi:DNA-binding CsgD family transcriptional regulator